MTRTSKYSQLLEIKDVRRWYDNLKASSLITATVYLRTLGLYCELEGLNPESIVSAFNQSTDNGKQFKNRFTDFIRDLETKGKKGSYVVRFKKVLKSWLRFNDLEINFNVKIKDADRNPTTESERVPSAEELLKVLRKASTRARTSISLMAFSGLRPETLGNFDGTDGLKFSDFPDLELEKNQLKFKQVPARLIVRRTLSKARHQYFTFIPEETVRNLEDYFEERIKHGEKITMDSPVIGFDVLKRGQLPKNKFLRTLLITRDIKDTFNNVGLDMRPYILRAYFATALDISESKGMISHPWRMYIMGHKGDIEARYSTNKRVPQTTIEEMRNAYSECLLYLVPGSKKAEEKDMQKKFKEQILLMDGFTKEEIDELGLLNLEDEELRNMRREKLFGSKDPAKDNLSMAKNDKTAMHKLKNGARQKIIPSHAIEAYLSEGFEFISSIPGDKAIVKLPDRL